MFRSVISFELLFDKVWLLFKVHYFAFRFMIALAPFFEMAVLLPLNSFGFFFFFEESVGRNSRGLLLGSLFCVFCFIDLRVYASTGVALITGAVSKVSETGTVMLLQFSFAERFSLF